MSQERIKKIDINRRGFGKFFGIALGSLILSSCTSKTPQKETLEPTIKGTETPTPFSPETPTPTKTLTLTLTFTDTLTPTPTLTRNERERLRLIEKYGKAEAIPAFEFHGDYYNMYTGYYMNPKTFRTQMEYLSKNEYHGVTGEELTAFLDGTLDLPKRSVILTTDSGNVSVGSIERMILVLQETGMHFISFIQTQRMGEGESVLCKDNVCWKTFRKAYDSGTFSIGCHTETHRDFIKDLSEKEGLKELAMSKKKIENNLGIAINGLAWPFESCPRWKEKLSGIGFKYAFSGWSKSLLLCSVEKSDSFRYNLPRIFPPAPTGVSMRPNNYTLQEILETYCR